MVLEVRLNEAQHHRRKDLPAEFVSFFAKFIDAIWQICRGSPYLDKIRQSYPCRNPAVPTAVPTMARQLPAQFPSFEELTGGRGSIQDNPLDQAQVINDASETSTTTS